MHEYVNNKDRVVIIDSMDHAIFKNNRQCFHWKVFEVK